MANVVKLGRTNQEYIPQIVVLIRQEIPKLRAHYDSKKIGAFLGALTEDYFRAIVESGGRQIFPIRECSSGSALYAALSETDSVEGFLLSTSYTKGRLKVTEILVILAAEKSRGTGTTLIHRFFDDVYDSEDQPDAVYLTVSRTNTGAIRFYERLGFRSAGSHPDFPAEQLYCMNL